MWLKTYDIVSGMKDEIATFINRYVREGYEIVLTGAGTSAYIGNALQWVLAGTLLDKAKAIATTDIITEASSLFNAESKVLLVSFARSGNSPESVGAINLVNKTAGKAAHVFITCNEKGKMTAMADSDPDNTLLVLLPPETNDLSLAMTSSYSSMFLACAMIANIDKIAEHKAQIEALSQAVEAALQKYSEPVGAIADREFTRAVFLGSGELMGVAEESVKGAVKPDPTSEVKRADIVLITNESLMNYFMQDQKLADLTALYNTEDFGRLNKQITKSLL